LNNIVYYFISGPRDWGLKQTEEEPCGQFHLQTIYEGKKLVWPKTINDRSICPEEIEEVIRATNSKKWMIADKLSTGNALYCIENHINRSGLNFLRGKTPHKNKVMFPDVSSIYNKMEGLERIKTSTVGPERFKNSDKTDKTIWSEAVGLISPVVYYSGIQIFAVGTARPEEKGLKILSYSF